MKSAIVFGGSGYLGKAIARELVLDGYYTIITYCSHKPADMDDLDASAFQMLQCDISDPKQVESVLKKAILSFGSVKLVVNAAGVALKQSLLANISSADISSLIQIDLLGALYISREAAIAMHKDHDGCIIHISSMWGSIGASCEVPYSAAKGGLNALTKALAKELAPDGIRVNAIAPGLILSPMNSHLSEEELSLFKEETPLSCYITPEDIMNAVRYLISAQHVTGQILAVDGGIVI